MVPLNLPQFKCNIRKNDGKYEIFDVIRKKYVALTPEEWVRQHFVHFLIKDLGYPRSLVSVESGTRYHQLKKRTDIVVYDRNMAPLLLAECKSFKLKLNQSGMDQASLYNRSLQAKYLVVTNGLQHFCCEFNNGSYTFLDRIPMFEE